MRVHDLHVCLCPSHENEFSLLFECYLDVPKRGLPGWTGCHSSGIPQCRGLLFTAMPDKACIKELENILPSVNLRYLLKVTITISFCMKHGDIQ